MSYCKTVSFDTEEIFTKENYDLLNLQNDFRHLLTWYLTEHPNFNEQKRKLKTGNIPGT